MTADPQVEPVTFDNMCSTEALFQPQLSVDEQCAMATEHCEAASMFNFYKQYFCTLSTSNLAFYPVGLIALTIAFYLLSFTADEFLSPSLQQISKTFKLSESLAGVTLLAFGGGAPDVFASLSAAQGGDLEGIEMAIAVLLGSSFFILSVINAGVIYYSPSTITLNRQFFIRDSSFLLAGLVLLLYSIAIRGAIDLTMSILFMVLYAVYVVVVFCHDRQHEKEANSEVAKKAAQAAKMTELDSLQSFGVKPATSAKANEMSYDFENQFNQESSAFYYIGKTTADSSSLMSPAANEQNESLLSVNHSTESSNSSLSKFMLKEDYFATNTSASSENKSDEGKMQADSSSDSEGGKKKAAKLNEMFILQNLKVTIKRDNLKRKRKNSAEEKAQLRISRKDPAERRKQAIKNCFHTLIERPVRFICKMTIPTSEKEKWHRGFASCNPPCALLVFLMAGQKLNPLDTVQQLAFIGSIVLGVNIRFLTQRTTAPSAKVMCVFEIFSFLMSMCWIYVLCEVIVDLLELFGVITGLPSSLLGLTILSWGNSLGDTIASISISKRGFGEMALTGCIAGPAFNLMLGLGVTTFMCNLQSETGRGIEFDIHTGEGVSSLATIVACLISLISLSWVIFVNDFKVKQHHAKILVIIYVLAILDIAYVTNQ